MSRYQNKTDVNNIVPWNIDLLRINGDFNSDATYLFNNNLTARSTLEHELSVIK